MSSLESHNTAEIPYHLALIPDGNRRWAKDNGLPSFEGHRRGVKIMRDIAIAAFDRGVKVFTAYAFSMENWKRASDEVGYLMDIFHNLLTKEFAEFEQRQVRFRLIGRRDGLSPKLLKAVDDLEARTAEFTAGTLGLCLNYGGQYEIAHAAAALIRAGVTADEVTPERLAAELYAPEIPPVDLLIRTSGEQRISGYMLWRSAYAELIFIDKNFPDMTVADLDTALADYASRQRRFGA